MENKREQKVEWVLDLRQSSGYLLLLKLDFLDPASCCTGTWSNTPLPVWPLHCIIVISHPPCLAHCPKEHKNTLNPLQSTSPKVVSGILHWVFSLNSPHCSSGAQKLRPRLLKVSSLFWSDVCLYTSYMHHQLIIHHSARTKVWKCTSKQYNVSVL